MGITDAYIKARKNMLKPNDPILRQQFNSEAIFMMKYQVENYPFLSHIWKGNLEYKFLPLRENNVLNYLYTWSDFQLWFWSMFCPYLKIVLGLTNEKIFEQAPGDLINFNILYFLILGNVP